MKQWTLLFFLLGAFCFAEESHPYQILVFRHGEKYLTKQDYDAPLSHKGERRAAYLVGFFLEGEDPIIDQKEHEIAAICVPRIEETIRGNPVHYVRARQTVIPLYHQAQSFRLETSGKEVEIFDTLPLTDPKPLFDQFMGEPRFAGKTIIVCWEHHHIPDFFDTYFPKAKEDLKHLGENRYDVVWMIRWDEGKPVGTTLYQEVDL